MSKRLILTGVIFLVVGVLMVSYLSTQDYKSRVVLGGKTFNVDVADNDYTMQKGLSGRKLIADNEGMIFIFGKLDKHGFWMKEMKFPIDIIWMDKNFVINHIESNVEPSTYPTIFYPENNALYVLEVRAGQSSILGVKLGDKAQFVR